MDCLLWIWKLWIIYFFILFLFLGGAGGTNCSLEQGNWDANPEKFTCPNGNRTRHPCHVWEENIYIHCDDATWEQGNWSKLTRCVLNTHCSKAAEVASSFVQVASSLAQVASSTNQKASRIYYFYYYFNFFPFLKNKKQL
jgi:hypothetical protein